MGSALGCAVGCPEGLTAWGSGHASELPPCACDVKGRWWWWAQLRGLLSVHDAAVSQQGSAGVHTPKRCRRICWLRVSRALSRLPLLALDVRALRSAVGGLAAGSLSKLEVAARRGPRLLRLMPSPAGSLGAGTENVRAAISRRGGCG